MKKILLFLAACVVSASTFAQRTVPGTPETSISGTANHGIHTIKGNSPIADAMRAVEWTGSDKFGIYTCTNNSKKYWSKIDVDAVCKHNDIIVFEELTSTATRFGDIITTISSFKYIWKDDIPKYTYAYMNETTTPFEKLTAKGTAFTYHWDSKGNYAFYRHDDVLWSGSVKDGRIQGTGVGFSYDTVDKRAIIFSGDFCNGLPQGQVTFTYIWWTDRDTPFGMGIKGAQKSFACEAGQYSDGMLAIKKNGKYGFVDQNGKWVIQPMFSDVVRGFENGQAIVSRQDTTELIINKQAKVLGITENQVLLFKKREEERIALEKQKELERIEQEKQRKIEEEKRAKEREEARARRREALFNLRRGDIVIYREGYVHTDSFLWVTYHRESYDMLVKCYVEDIIADKENGELRLQVRIGEVSSTSDDYYATVSINGMECHRGDVIWIKPLYDESWSIY